MRLLLSDKPEIEYLDGRPYPKVSPKRTHAFVQSEMFVILRECAGARGQAGTEWSFRVGEADGTQTVLIPDVGYVSMERQRGLSPAALEEPPFSPDIAVEVRSPSHRAALLAKKVDRYLRTGSLLVLDVDPQRRRIIAHSAGGARAYEERDDFEHPAAPWLRFPVSRPFSGLTLPS